MHESQCAAYEYSYFLFVVMDYQVLIKYTSVAWEDGCFSFEKSTGFGMIHGFHFPECPTSRMSNSRNVQYVNDKCNTGSGMYLTLISKLVAIHLYNSEGT